MTNLSILVGTKNPEKLQAVLDAFQTKFRKVDIEVKGVPCDSGIPSGQPYGMSSTYQAAQNRLIGLHGRMAFPQFAKMDYLVSIENGITDLVSDNGTIYLDFPIVIIYDVKTKKSVTQFGQSRPIPLLQMRNLKTKMNGSQIGEWCVKWYERLNLSQSRGDIIKSTLLLTLECLLRSSS